jgi:uncharacterized protein
MSIMSKENPLPQKVDPFRFAENEVSLEGIISIKDMARLCPSLGSDAGQVEVSVAFGVDEQGTRFMRGHYSTHVVLQCQRCMETFENEISGNLLLGMVTAEEAVSELPKNYDPIVIKEGSLSIQNVIEDELILSLPIVPMHSIKNCKITLPLAMGSAEKAETESENPFKVIELLRVKRNIDK